MELAPAVSFSKSEARLKWLKTDFTLASSITRPNKISQDSGPW